MTTSAEVLSGKQPPPPRAGAGPGGQAFQAPQRAGSAGASRFRRDDSTVGRALGWLSLGLGIAAMFRSRSLGAAIGMESHEGALKMAGARELVAATGLLGSGNPTPWLWSRVVGDVMDLAMLGGAAVQGARRNRALAALGVVAAVTAVDIGASVSVTRRKQLRRYGGTAASRGAEGVLDESVMVNKSPEECYRYWRKLEQVPRFMPVLRSVTETDAQRSHWVLKAAPGVQIEWDAELTHDDPGRRLAWRSLPNPQIAHAGVVRFNPAPGKRGTLVRVITQYRLLPGFDAPRRLAGSLDSAPRARVREDLRRFKQLLEAGEVPTTEGQPHGRRGLLGKTLQRWSLT